MNSSSKAKKKPYLSTVAFGAISIASYIIIFTHQSFVMDNFIKGGLYAALPIITALYISFIHGAFASGVLSIIGLSAKGH